MTEAEITAIVDRVIAALGPRFDRIEAALREVAKSQGAVTRAITRVTTAVRSLVRAEEEEDTTQDPVHVAVVGLKVNAIGKAGGVLNGIAAAPGAAWAWAWSNKVATGLGAVLLGMFLINLAAGTPFLAACGQVLVQAGTGLAPPSSTGRAP